MVSFWFANTEKRNTIVTGVCKEWRKKYSIGPIPLRIEYEIGRYSKYAASWIDYDVGMRIFDPVSFQKDDSYAEKIFDDDWDMIRLRSKLTTNLWIYKNHIYTWKLKSHITSKYVWYEDIQTDELHDKSSMLIGIKKIHQINNIHDIDARFNDKHTNGFFWKRDDVSCLVKIDAFDQQSITVKVNTHSSTMTIVTKKK
eukprot:426819_1